MTTSAIPAALDWLVNACSGGAIAPTGGNTIAVYIQDGPLVTLDPTVFPQRLAIGWDGLAPGEPAAVGEQEFAAINLARTRNEEFHIWCTAEDWSGDTSMKPRRDNVWALVAQVELLIRGVNGNPGDATMGGTVLYSQITATKFTEDQGASGAYATVAFQISAKARLTT